MAHACLRRKEREKSVRGVSLAKEQDSDLKYAQGRLRPRSGRGAQLGIIPLLPQVRAHACGQRRQALDLSEGSFQALVEKLADIIVVLNGDGTMRYQNSVAEQVLGYKPEDALGVSGFDFVHPEDIEKVQTLFVQLLRRPRRIQTMVLRVRHRANRWRVLEASAVNLLADPRVEGIVIVCRDVTERKQSETDLRQAYKEAKRTTRTQLGKLQRADKYVQAEVRQRQRAEVALRECEAQLRALNCQREQLEAQLPRISGSASELRSAISVVRIQLEAALAHPEQVDWRKLGPTLLAETRRVNQLLEEFFTSHDALYLRDAPL